MILEDLYRGKYIPFEHISARNDHEEFEQLQEAILAALPEDKKELMAAFQNSFMEILMDEGEAAYAEGVRFGVQLMLEAKPQ